MPEAGVTCFTYAYIEITLNMFKSAVTTSNKAFTISITSLTCTKFVKIVVLWQKGPALGYTYFM